MHAIKAGDTMSQEFQWKMQGLEVPLGFARLSGRVRNRSGDVIQDLEHDSFGIVDADNGLFSLTLNRNTEAAQLEIYGEIPRLQKQMICKREIEWL